MRVLCLFVRNGTTKYPEALTVLDQWYAQHGLLDQRTLWVIDNDLPPNFAPRTIAPGVILRSGDNSAWEFSAWARTLREMGPEVSKHDVVHFVTSAFNTLYTRYLEHFHPGMLEYLNAHRVCLGHIDSYDQPVELAGHSSQAWIRTCFFFLPTNVARGIETWAAFTESNRIFPHADSTDFRNDAPLSQNYRQRIRVWLEGQDVGGHTWHSPIRTGWKEARRFQKKTLAILNEHNFAITLRKMRVPLVDYCWLWSLRQTPYSGPGVAAESDQLAIRRRILGIPS